MKARAARRERIASRAKQKSSKVAGGRRAPGVRGRRASADAHQPRQGPLSGGRLQHKGEVVDYYAKVAEPRSSPPGQGRALTLRRFPEEGSTTSTPRFFEKRCPKHRPNWVKTAKTCCAGPRAGNIDFCVCDGLPDPGLDGAAGGDRAASFRSRWRDAMPDAVRPYSPSTSTPARRRTSSTAAGWRCGCARCSATSASSASRRPQARRAFRSTSRSTPRPAMRRPNRSPARSPSCTREADAGPRRLEDEKGRTPGQQGVRRLVPEPPAQDDDCRLLAAGAGATDRLDTADLAGGRTYLPWSNSGDAGSTLVFEASAACWSESSAMATSSPRCWTWNRRSCPSSSRAARGSPGGGSLRPRRGGGPGRVGGLPPCQLRGRALGLDEDLLDRLGKSVEGSPWSRSPVELDHQRLLDQQRESRRSGGESRSRADAWRDRGC